MRQTIVLIAALAISFLGFVPKTKAQDTLQTRIPLIIKTGFVYTPQGSLSLQTPNEGTKQFATLIFVTVFNKGNATLVPFYQFNSTAIGTAIIYKVKPWLSPYSVIQKNLRNENTYLSLGAMTPIPGGPFNGFIEFGNSFPEWSPTMYAGVFIGLTRPIKTK